METQLVSSIMTSEREQQHDKGKIHTCCHRGETFCICVFIYLPSITSWERQSFITHSWTWRPSSRRGAPAGWRRWWAGLPQAGPHGSLEGEDDTSRSCEHTQLPEETADLAPCLQPPAKKKKFDFSFLLQLIQQGGLNGVPDGPHKDWASPLCDITKGRIFRTQSLSEQSRQNKFDRTDRHFIFVPNFCFVWKLIMKLRLLKGACFVWKSP